MARTLMQWVTEIREYLSKDKAKAARKTLEKAQKSGVAGALLDEVELELLLAEGGGAAAADMLRKVARGSESRASGAVKLAESHLRRSKEDHPLRDALWEVSLAQGDNESALRHVLHLVGANAIDGASRGKALLDRKDAIGAAGIFLLASCGALKTDRMKLADRLLQNEGGGRVLGGVAQALQAQGKDDGAVHYVLAQLAQKSGERDKFLEHAGRAFGESPDEVWTWTMANVEVAERLEIAVRNGSLRHLLQAAEAAPKKAIVDLAQKSGGEGGAARALRAMALVLQGKAANACRVLEGLAHEDAAACEPVAAFFRAKAKDWPGAREVFASVVGTSLATDGAKVKEAVDGLLLSREGERNDAWARAAARLVEVDGERDDLRRELGLYMMGEGDQKGAAALLGSERHLPVAQAWAGSGKAAGPVLLRAAALAEEHGKLPASAEWLLSGAKKDAALLSELGRKLAGATVSAETALRSAGALHDQGQAEEAAGLLDRLPLDAETGNQLEAFLKERRLHDDRHFQAVSFRAALALGDLNRARRLFRNVTGNVQALAKEAAAHADPGRVLADVLIGQGKPEVAVGLVDSRRASGDDARVLLPLADGLIKAAPKLGMARLVRAKLLKGLGRDEDAVRDLRTIAFDAGEIDEAHKLLLELGTGASLLGRADILIARKQHPAAVQELDRCTAPAAERLERFEAICGEKPTLDAAWRGRGRCLLELARIPDAADANLKRFHCPDSDRMAVATDLEGVAAAALKVNDIGTAGRILEHLPDHVSDGAERAIAVIGEDKRAAMLILKSKLLLSLQRTDDAVRTLANLVESDPASRPQAAKALDAIVEAMQARPEADFALADAYQAMGQTGQALAALARLYEDDLTGKDNVVRAAQKLVVRADDADVRIFLGRVCLDMRDHKGATEHAIHARRLRPAARRECVQLLQKALDLDAFAPGTHFALAEAHLAGDEADDAVRHFRAAVEVDKSRAPSAIRAMEESAPRSAHQGLLWLAVGTTYAEFQRDHAAAVTAFTKGLDTNPPSELRVPLLLGRGDSYAAQRQDDAAFDDFDEASKHDLLERRYYEFLRGRHRKRLLDAAEAAKAKASEGFAHAAEACRRFIGLGRAAESVDIAQRALAAAPTDLGPRYLVGVCLHAAGRYDAAAQVLETVRASAGAGTDVGRAARMLLAESYLDQGDRARARHCLTEIEALDAAYPGLEARRAALAPPADDPHAPPPLFVRPEFPRPTS